MSVLARPVRSLLLFVPDIGILGYIRGNLAATYDLLHTEIGPLALGAASVYWQWPFGLLIALVWLAHYDLVGASVRADWER